MVDSGALAALSLGFLLGLKHATDADHVVAVSTMVAQYRNAWRGIWVGGSWGLGHTTPLLVLGVIILVFEETVLDRYETVAPVFEAGVGIMLVLLGVQVFWNLRRGRLHLHSHTHDEGPHVHIHSTHDPASGPEVEAAHGLFHFGRPFFRMKSYTIGVVHGLAGSAAVMLILLPTLSSFWVGVGLSAALRRGHDAVDGWNHAAVGRALRPDRRLPVAERRGFRGRRAGQRPHGRRSHVRHRPWHGHRPLLAGWGRRLYLRDTLRLPARGSAPLHTPHFSGLLGAGRSGAGRRASDPPGE